MLKLFLTKGITDTYNTTYSMLTDIPYKILNDSIYLLLDCSDITDNVYYNRISHIKQLRKFNIDISYNDNKIIINGGHSFKNCHCSSLDLRCGASLLIVSSLNKKYSYISNINNIYRGYEDIKYKKYSLFTL